MKNQTAPPFLEHSKSNLKLKNVIVGNVLLASQIEIKASMKLDKNQDIPEESEGEYEEEKLSIDSKISRMRSMLDDDRNEIDAEIDYLPKKTL